MDNNEHIQELKEKEIKRLTSPINYAKGTWKTASAAYDCEGNEIDSISTFNGKKYIMEPKKGILSDDEILVYAGDSKEASKIRLKRGIGDFGDKKNLHQNLISTILSIEFLLFVSIGVSLLILLDWIYKLIIVIIFLLPLLFLAYLLFIKDYTEIQHNQSSFTQEKVNSKKETSNEDLFLLFESKEKIAREMIEKRFPAPQLTNSKFNGVLDNCRNVVESQVEILNALTPTEKTKYEIDSRKKLIKQLISKIDDLTNELILSEENNLEEVVEEMDRLISSVKDY